MKFTPITKEEAEAQDKLNKESWAKFEETGDMSYLLNCKFICTFDTEK